MDTTFRHQQDGCDTFLLGIQDLGKVALDSPPPSSSLLHPPPSSPLSRGARAQGCCDCAGSELWMGARRRSSGSHHELLVLGVPAVLHACGGWRGSGRDSGHGRAARRGSLAARLHRRCLTTRNQQRARGQGRRPGAGQGEGPDGGRVMLQATGDPPAPPGEQVPALPGVSRPLPCPFGSRPQPRVPAHPLYGR